MRKNTRKQASSPFETAMAMLEIALKASADVAENGSVEARQSTRAEAIARAFRSERWWNEVAYGVAMTPFVLGKPTFA